ncbi:MAG: hypothetical protein ABJE47_25445 [bacterium]
MRRRWVFGSATVLGAVIACGGSGDTFTLYRNGVANDSLRIHVATFDAKESADYNHENCEQARELFQVQPATRSRYWCEKGRFKEK